MSNAQCRNSYTFLLLMLYSGAILCVEYFIQFQSHDICINIRHVSATIFGHHQVVLLQSLSTLSANPHPLANVYNWGRSYCCLQCSF
jgi:hypothetical protein